MVKSGPTSHDVAAGKRWLTGIFFAPIVDSVQSALAKRRKVIHMLEFFQSLGVIGYVVMIVLVLALLNIKKLIVFRSPLDSRQHKTGRATGGAMNPDQAESPLVDASDR